MEGKSFTNFTEFKEFIKKHEEEQHVLFVTSGSKKLINGHPAKESIQYEWLKLVCKQGRATKPTSSKGIRPNQRSWKHDCGAVIRAVIRHSDVTGYQFVITKAILSHENHPTDHLTALVYPENRRIKPDETVDLMVGTKIPQSELRQIISQKQNKCVLGKDVENYRRKLKDPCTDSEGVEKILNSIKVGGGMVKYGVTPENEFLYLAYMTKEMIGSLKANKTILIIDCTYKVNEYLFPLLNVMCIDANGNGVPVLHAFNMGEQHFLVKLEQLKTFIYHIRANKEFVITNVSEALAETNISLNGGCVDAEFLPIASTSQALAETNVSLNGECVGEEFVPINRAQPFMVHNSENNLSGSDIVDSSKVTTDTFSNVMLKKVKTKGRPNNKQHFTKKKRLGFPYSSVSKKLKIVSSTEKEVVGNVKCSSANDVNVFVDNHVECLENKRNGDECAECGLEEVSKENCIDGKLMNWIGCMAYISGWDWFKTKNMIKWENKISRYLFLMILLLCVVIYIEYTRTFTLMTWKKQYKLQTLGRPPDFVSDMTDRLTEMLNASTDMQSYKVTNKCNNLWWACRSESCSRHLSQNHRERLWDILSPKLTLTDQDREKIVSLSSQIPASNIIFATATSANHYYESQAMIHRLHTVVFPYVQDKTFVLLDLGLTKEQRNKTEKACQCHVISFPFELFPKHFRDLHSCAWKPVFIMACMMKTKKLVVYQDASIYWKEHIVELLDRGDKLGLQLWGGRGMHNIPGATMKGMLDFFGDQPCAYINYTQLQAGVSVFKQTPFVVRAILEPWAKCVMELDCFCPNCTRGHRDCSSRNNTLHRCHRYDQSTFSLIVTKLFAGERYRFHMPKTDGGNGYFLLAYISGWYWFKTKNMIKLNNKISRYLFLMILLLGVVIYMEYTKLFTPMTWMKQ
ncbi:sedoheptulokinase, partial [Biomphalaria glabrata]